MKVIFHSVASNLSYNTIQPLINNPVCIVVRRDNPDYTLASIFRPVRQMPD